MFVTKFRVALYVKSGLFKLLLRQSTRRSNIIPGDVYFKSPPEYLHSGKSSLTIIKLISGGQLQVSRPRRGLDYARKEPRSGWTNRIRIVYLLLLCESLFNCFLGTRVGDAMVV